MGLAAATSALATIRFRGIPLRRVNAASPAKASNLTPNHCLASALKARSRACQAAKRSAQMGWENGKMYRDDGDGCGDDGVSFSGAEHRHRRQRLFRHEQQRRSSSSKKREHVTREQMKARE